VHVRRRERIFVPHHDNAAGNVVHMPIEIGMPAQAEIKHFGNETAGRCGAKERRAWEGSAGYRIRELRIPAPPAGIVHMILAHLCIGHSRKPLAGEGDCLRLAGRAREPASAGAE
jgi:hypothetical protein